MKKTIKFLSLALVVVLSSCCLFGCQKDTKPDIIKGNYQEKTDEDIVLALSQIKEADEIDVKTEGDFVSYNISGTVSSKLESGEGFCEQTGSTNGLFTVEGVKDIKDAEVESVKKANINYSYDMKANSIYSQEQFDAPQAIDLSIDSDFYYADDFAYISSNSSGLDNGYLAILKTYCDGKIKFSVKDIMSVFETYSMLSSNSVAKNSGSIFMTEEDLEIVDFVNQLNAKLEEYGIIMTCDFSDGYKFKFEASEATAIKFTGTSSDLIYSSQTSDSSTNSITCNNCDIRAYLQFDADGKFVKMGLICDYSVSIVAGKHSETDSYTYYLVINSTDEKASIPEGIESDKEYTDLKLSSSLSSFFYLLK